MNKVCIVIPAYRENLNIIEKTSLKQLIKIVGDKYPIKLVSWYKVDGHFFDDREYREILGDIDNQYFDASWFVNTETYSSLLESVWFYRAFEDHEYILIYQTDCYMVCDTLTDWINKDYDYIGAPIVANHYIWKTAPTVGNGGLSLRKVKTFIDICDPEGQFMKNHGDKVKKFTSSAFEDNWFCQDIYSIYDFKKPKYVEASTFAIDMNPDTVIRFAGALPMGLHAYDKNIHFWKHHIKELDNYDLLAACDAKYLETEDLSTKQYYAHQKEQFA